MGKEELIQEAFNHLNGFKRHRALSEIKPGERNFHELQMYKKIDQLELALRAIKKEIRYATTPVAPGEDTDDESDD